jgi:hypothetical protein
LGLWRRHGLEKVAEAVMMGLERWKKSDDWNRDGGRYIPMPATWLRQRRWEIEDKTDQPKLQSGAW